jgi:hypothetical protein
MRGRLPPGLPPGLARMMMGEETDGTEPVTPVSLDVEVDRLTNAFAAYHRPEAVREGALVRYKSGLTFSFGNQPPTGLFVVLGFFPERKPNWDQDSGTYGVAYDLHLGYYDGDGDFMYAWSDSRRFEVVNPDDLLTT